MAITKVDSYCFHPDSKDRTRSLQSGICVMMSGMASHNDLDSHKCRLYFDVNLHDFKFIYLNKSLDLNSI